MKFELPAFVLNILRLFDESHYEIYIVGGAVRDLQTSRTVDDWDFTTNAIPSEILKIFPEGFYDNKFGTVGLPFKRAAENGSGITEIYEVTTFRTEQGYTDRRHPDKVLWGKTLEEDLARRDFTINAMALRLRSGQALKKENDFEVIDPYGGQKDLKEKMIRAVRDPNERFKEDALRMMRGIRIATELDFSIEEKTFEAIKNNSKLINEISGERIRDEVMKMMGSDHPAEGIMRLFDSGILEEILPEITKGCGITQAKHHKYDVFTHSAESLRNCPSKDSLVRFATLLHDVGKSFTYRGEGEQRTFHNHEVMSAKIARGIADRWHFSKERRDRLVNLVRWHQFSVDEFQTDKAIRRFIKRVGNENLRDIFDLRVGDRLGGGCVSATSWRLRKYMDRTIDVQKHTPGVKDLKVKGNDVMEILKIEPGPRVGEILNKLFEEITEEPEKNEREGLLKRVREME